MVLDEPKETDDVFEVDGFTYIVDKGLMKEAKDISVDFVEQGMRSGFLISSQLPQSNSCGSCSC